MIRDDFKFKIEHPERDEELGKKSFHLSTTTNDYSWDSLDFTFDEMDKIITSYKEFKKTVKEEPCEIMGVDEIDNITIKVPANKLLLKCRNIWRNPAKHLGKKAKGKLDLIWVAPYEETAMTLKNYLEKNNCFDDKGKIKKKEK